jgi:hypothetical protein
MSLPGFPASVGDGVAAAPVGSLYHELPPD